jgi:hypothetical protein
MKSTPLFVLICPFGSGAVSVGAVAGAVATGSESVGGGSDWLWEGTIMNSLQKGHFPRFPAAWSGALIFFEHFGQKTVIGIVSPLFVLPRIQRQAILCPWSIHGCATANL